MSLSTGASLITLSLLLNKVSGLYGLLALLTGYRLNALQLSMYIYSLFALALTAFLAPHIRTQSPLHCLALAWFYVIDSAINAIYTAAFGVTWFLVLAQHNASKKPSGPGAGTIDDTAGFTSPIYNVSNVEVIATPFATGQHAVAVGTPAFAPAGANGSLGNAVLEREGMNSIGIIIALWTIRLYFCVIMLAFARMVLRQHMTVSGMKNISYTTASTDSRIAENPFGVSKPEGQGWKGRLGRLFVSFGRTYWLGSDEEDGWMTGVGGKSRQSIEAGNFALPKEESGPLERERRRRSGTGPPLPSSQFQQGQQKLGVPMQNM